MKENVRAAIFALLFTLLAYGAAFGQASTPPENRNWKDLVDQMSAPTAPTPAISKSFSGAGLNDLTPGTAYNRQDAATFVITIATASTPDTFDWTETGGSGSSGVGVAITGAAQTLADGFQITFAATTGHTATNSWTIVAKPRLRMYFDSSGAMKALWSNSTTTTMMMASGGNWDLANSDVFRWSSTSASTGTKDVGLARLSAGVLKVTDGSTGLGTLNVNYVLYQGSTSGSIAVHAPAIAGTQSYTWPTGYPASNGYPLTMATDGTMSVSTTIADTFLATISTAGKVADTALSANVATLAGIQTFSGAKTFSSQIISTLATGTAPLSITSTTPVANLTLAADSQLPTISTAGKVSDSALSANVGLLNGTQTITGVRTFTAAPIFKQDGIAATVTDGFALSNTTLATSGVPVQESPAIRFAGHVWNTTAVAADNTSEARMLWIPASSSAPTGRLTLQVSINGGAWSEIAQFASSNSASGTLAVNNVNSAVFNVGTITITSATNLGAGTQLGWSSRAAMASPADGQAVIRNAAATAIAGLLMGRTVSAKTANYTVGIFDSNTQFTNTGAAGEVDFTLPAATLGSGNSGLIYHFYINAGQVLKVIAAGTDTIQDASTTSAGGGNISASTVGNYITVQLVASGKWAVISKVGTWTTV